MPSKKIDVVDIVRHEGPIMLPKKLSLQGAIDSLLQRMQYEAQPVRIREVIPALPWDGAIALTKAIEQLFGYALQIPTVFSGMFGTMSNPPMQISVETGPDTTTLIPWGRFSLPGIPGWIETLALPDSEGRISFAVASETIHEHEHTIRKLILRCREIVAAESIYRGKAIEVTFTRDGELLSTPDIKFLRVPPMPPIFNKPLETAIETNIFTPIRYREVLAKNAIPFKRGILLAGEYGTGKTLLAQAVARETVMNNMTFIYGRNPNDLSHLLTFAERFQPAVLLTEDVDRVAGVDRTDDVNDVLNTLDGVGNKKSEVMLILTTNHPESINPAMRRPGRIDVILPVTLPDAEAAERLVRLYGGSRIAEGENLSAVGMALFGQRPATIRETVERAKLDAIRRSKGETSRILASDLLAAADVTIAEAALFTPKPIQKPVEELGQALGDRLGRLLVKGAHAATQLNGGYLD